MKRQIILALAVIVLTASAYTILPNSSRETNFSASVKISKGYESKVPAEEKSVFITFNKEETGKMPTTWSNFFTGKGNIGKWEIREDDGNKVLAQVSQKNFGYHFDVIVLNKPSYSDVEITARFKGVKGSEDQGGGPVWRYQDPDNYYIARANPLENNFRVYKVIKGNRKQLGTVDFDIPTGEWHTIKIRMIGDHITCAYDGKKYLDVKDNSFPRMGKVGLWTKADAFTYFDDFTAKPLK